MDPIEMGIVIGDNYVITVYDDEITYLNDIYQEFQLIEGRMENPGYILYHILIAVWISIPCWLTMLRIESKRWSRDF